MTTTTTTYTADPDRVLAKASRLAEAMQASNAMFTQPTASRSLKFKDEAARKGTSNTTELGPARTTNRIAFKDATSAPKLTQRSNTAEDSRTLTVQPPALERSVTAPDTESEKANTRPGLLRTLSPETWPLRKASDESKPLNDRADADPLPRLKPQDILIPTSAREHAVSEGTPLPTTPRLRESTFIPDHTKLRWAHPESGKFKRVRPTHASPASSMVAPSPAPSSISFPPLPTTVPPTPVAMNEMNMSLRESVKSSTTYMSSINDFSFSVTERSSVQTSRTSMSDHPVVNPGIPPPIFDEELTVEECIAMYEQGFEDDPPPAAPNKPAKPSPLSPKRDEKIPPVPKIAIPLSPKKSFREIPKDAETLETRTRKYSDLRSTVPAEQKPAVPKPSQIRRPSIPPSSSYTNPTNEANTHLPVPSQPAASGSGRITSAQIFAGDIEQGVEDPANPEPPADPNTDRYGFKKNNQHISLNTYESWDVQYKQYLDRRRQKWNDLMRQHSLNATHPAAFPPRSDKVKRFIRKGIPPDWRGAAWFWYAGGPARVAQNPGLYQDLVDKCGQYGQLGDRDREHIERDLYRTFPDNHRFKRVGGDPDSSRPDSAETASSSNPTTPPLNHERPMIGALRRVLQAFAVHQPRIGYCQSLNFLAGFLLLFLDGDEEKAFHLLCILTNDHLPGTHGIALEGANVDMSVLMSTLKDREPTLWTKLDDSRDSVSSPISPSKSNKLPTVSLATTSWFMSCFIGSLPIEPCCRVWDVLFYEGSKTLFRIALGIFRLGGNEIRAIRDPMEIFQVVQTLPRKLVDANALMEASFGKDLEGRGLLSSETVKRRRDERRTVYQKEQQERQGGALRERTGSTTSNATEMTADTVSIVEEDTKRRPSISRGKSLRGLTRFKSKKSKTPPVPTPPTGL